MSKTDIKTYFVDDAESLTASSTSLEYPHPFSDPENAESWRKLYEETGYEGRHLFDPKMEWEPKEERRLLFKTEFYVTLWAFIMFLALDVDRYNLGNAVAGNLLQDLHITTDDYNLGNTINLVCFLSAELPSNLISKKIGPDRWIPIQIVLWSVVAITQCKMTSRGGFLATRALVGMLEGGFIPDMCLWMSYFYTGTELSVRVGYFYIANPLTQAFSALLAYGIFHLEGDGGWHGWQYVFLIEGLVTLVIGLLAFFMMPPSVTQTKTWFRPHGWYSPHEEKIMVNRILRDDPTKGDMNNRQAMSLKLILKCILNYDLWPIYIVRIFGDLQASPISTYMPILLRNMGFTTLQTNLLMIPHQFLGIITLLLQAHAVGWLNQYFPSMVAVPIWIFPCLAAMKWWPHFLENHWGSYVLIFIALGAPGTTAMSVPWCSHNSGSVGMRTVSGAVVNMFSQTSGIIGSNIFRSDDAPLYHRGLEQLVAISLTSFGTIVLTRFYYMWRNLVRDRKWKTMSAQEQAEYLRTTTDEGNGRLDFRFIY